MADKEERILITTRHKNEKLNMTFTDMYKEYTRQEAIERIAKAICETGIGCHTCHRENNKEECKKFIKGNLYLLYAEASLDALLGGKK